MPNPARDPSWPAWYQPEAATPATAPSPPQRDNRPLPDWYTPEQAASDWDKFDPRPGTKPPVSQSGTGPTPNAATPQWLKELDAKEAAANDWDSFDPAPPPGAPQGRPAHAVAAPSGDGWKDAYNFARTALVNGFSGLLGGIASIPEPISTLAQGQKPNDPGAATAYFADKGFNATGPEYRPQTVPGQYAMDAATYAAPALLGGEAVVPNLVRGAVAGTAAHMAEVNDLPPWLGPVATAGVELVGRHAVAPVIKPSLSSGADHTAGHVLNEVGGPPSAAVPPAIPGLRLSRGQLSGSPAQLALERDIADENAPTVSANNLDANRLVIRNHVASVAPGPAGSDAAAAQAANVEAARKGAKAAADNAWASVPPDVSVSTPNLKLELDRHVQGVTAAGDDDLLPMRQIDQIQGMPENAPLSALQARRSRLVTAAQDARNNGNTNSARVIQGVADILGKHIEDENNIVTGNAADLDAYKAARAATKDYYTKFGDDNKAGAQVADLTAGKIAPEATLARFLPPGAEGNGVQSLSRLKMAAGTGAGLNPARSYLVGKLQDAITGGPDAFQNVLDDYGYAFKDKDMFTPQQQGVFNDARDAVAQITRKAPPGSVTGSKTLTGLQSPTFARTLYGRLIGTVAPAVSKATGAAVGTALAKVAPVLGDKEIAGTLFGGEAGADIFKNMSTSARNNVIRILRAASADPALAQELQTKASAANLKMAPRTRNLLKSLGLSEAVALPGVAGADPADIGN